MSKARELANLGNAYSDGALSNRNLIINGAMQVAQRGTSFTNVSDYMLDRWAVGNPATNSVSQQFSTTLGMYYMDVTTSAGWGTYQWVENINARQLKEGDSITVSYWTNVLTGNFNVKTTNTSAFPYSTTIIDTAGSWYRRAATAVITAGQASDIASGAHFRLAIEPANNFYITGVQLEVGDTATPFEHRSYGDELARCQRYYNRIVGDVINTGIANGMSQSSSTGTFVMTFPQEMRVAPSLYQANLGMTDHTNYTSAVSGVSYGSVSKKSLRFGLTGTAVMTAYRPASVMATTVGGYLSFDAEL